MIRAFFKYLFFVAAILMLGQVRVKGESITNRLTREVVKVGEWGQEKWSETVVYAEAIKATFLTSWLQKKLKAWLPEERKTLPKPSEAQLPEAKEDISEADRKSLAELLK